MTGGPTDRQIDAAMSALKPPFHISRTAMKAALTAAKAAEGEALTTRGHDKDMLIAGFKRDIERLTAERRELIQQNLSRGSALAKYTLDHRYLAAQIEKLTAERDALAQACAELERRVQADYATSIISDLQAELAALRARPTVGFHDGRFEPVKESGESSI